jgi:hypothetical protein
MLDPTRVGVLDGGEVQPAFPRAQVGHVGEPQHVGSGGAKLPFDEVIGDPDTSTRATCAPPSSAEERRPGRLDCPTDRRGAAGRSSQGAAAPFAPVWLRTDATPEKLDPFAPPALASSLAAVQVLRHAIERRTTVDRKTTGRWTRLLRDGTTGRAKRAVRGHGRGRSGEAKEAVTSA